MTALFLLFTCVTGAPYGVEPRNVPIDRLLTNLTLRLKANTNDVSLLQIIARLHSMTYAQGKTNWLVYVQTNGFPIFGSEYLPGRADTVTDPQVSTNLKAHLDEAIKFYLRAQARAPRNPITALGLGWCYKEAGDKTNALSSLKRALILYNEERSKLPSTFDIVPREVAAYLLPLIDPENDRAEFDELKRIQIEFDSKHQAQLASEKEQRGESYTYILPDQHPLWFLNTNSAFPFGTRPISPLVISFNPPLPASALIDTNASVPFDLDGSGIPGRRWQWITTNAAWIVHLPRGGDVTSGLQLFGNVTFWLFWQNGYQALASLDDNNDGLLTGDELRDLALWRDLNSDGKSTPNEITSLKEAGITALELHYQDDPNNILTAPTGAHLQNGRTLPTFDLLLQRR